MNLEYLMKQKRWHDLLGTEPRDCIVDGRYISRRSGPAQYHVVWMAETPAQAQEIIVAWKAELWEMGIGSRS